VTSEHHWSLIAHATWPHQDNTVQATVRGGQAHQPSSIDKNKTAQWRPGFLAARGVLRAVEHSILRTWIYLLIRRSWGLPEQPFVDGIDPGTLVYSFQNKSLVSGKGLCAHSVRDGQAASGGGGKRCRSGWWRTQAWSFSHSLCHWIPTLFGVLAMPWQCFYLLISTQAVVGWQATISFCDSSAVYARARRPGFSCDYRNIVECMAIACQSGAHSRRRMGKLLAVVGAKGADQSDNHLSPPCIWSKIISPSLFRKSNLWRNSWGLRCWIEAEVNFFCRAKLSRRDYWITLMQTRCGLIYSARWGLGGTCFENKSCLAQHDPTWLCVLDSFGVISKKKRVLRDFRWFIRHLSSVVKSAGLNKSSYPQVPGSIPAENTSTQIHMDLSK